MSQAETEQQLRALVQAPRSPEAEEREQDEAAGDREARVVTRGAVRTKAKVRLSIKSGKVQAALFYKAHGRDFRRPIGSIDAQDRKMALKTAWDMAKVKGMLTD